MRFSIASASILALAASVSAADEKKSYLAAGDDLYLSATVAIDGFYHYALLTDAKSAVPANIVGGVGELEVDLSSIGGEGYTARLTLKDENGYSGLKHAIFNNGTILQPTPSFSLEKFEGVETLTVDKRYFEGFYACTAGVGVKQLYWSTFTDTNGTSPTGCEPVNLTPTLL